MSFFLPAYVFFFFLCWIKTVTDSCLSFLAAVIEPSLMDDPCDWNICAEAATPVKFSSGIERKKHTKPSMDLASKSGGPRRPEKAPSAPTPAARGEETPTISVVASREDRVRSPQQAGPTRKELQDALPKIPPLSSFKSCRPRFMSLEEAELDFHSFITAGLGRSVDVVREFRGQEDSEASVHGGSTQCAVKSETITLDDDSSECLRLCEKWRKSHFSHSASGSGSSHPKRDDEERPPVSDEPPIEVPQVTAPPVFKVEPVDVKREAPAPQSHPSDMEISPNPEKHDPSGFGKHNKRDIRTASKPGRRDEPRKRREKCGKRTDRVAEQGNRDHWRGDEDEHDGDDDDDDEEKWSAEAYWRASYRAWSDYYASMSAFHSPAYPSCYGAASSWMAAYRMNAVYMEELLKD